MSDDFFGAFVDTQPPTTFKLLTPADIEALPDLEYLIEGILPTSAFGVLYGQPQSGKSFVALSVAMAVANGEPWLGRTTRPGRVLYVAAEGVRGMKKRMRAQRERRRVEDANICFLGVPFDARDRKQIDGVLACIKAAGFPPDLIIIDTLARVAVGADENNAKDMGQIVEGFEALKRATGATILVIHHTRKDGGTERGSSALRGAADVMIACEATQGDGTKAAELTCEKMKDDEPFKPFSVSLEKVDLPDGKSSLVVSGILDMRSSLFDHGEKVVGLLRERFPTGAAHGDLKKTAVDELGLSGSVFDRTLRDLKKANKVRTQGAGKGSLYFPAEPTPAESKERLTLS